MIITNKIRVFKVFTKGLEKKRQKKKDFLKGLKILKVRMKSNSKQLKMKEKKTIL